MKVALVEYKFDAEEVLLHWIHLREKGSPALMLGDPWCFGYHENISEPKKISLKTTAFFGAPKQICIQIIQTIFFSFPTV